MQDFTLEAYRWYLGAIRNSYSSILRFRDFFSLPECPDTFIIIRHDVDRKPGNALKMARIEKEMGIHSTYYFRSKSHVFKADIISEIAASGHEIGYHYESLSDAKGNHKSALIDFEQNLRKLRTISPICTIAMHGSPLSPHDNRRLWRDLTDRDYLKKSLGILGDAYLDIDYQDIAYITDTGRNWYSARSNKRDMVQSDLYPNFKSGKVLLDSFKNCCYPKVIFQIHPERWTTSKIEYLNQWALDHFANIIKTIIR